ncbi:MAG UNVERIFIED_CONTAM: DUF1501 domain-containing protein [Planctomycetaceae bacterium]
MAGGGIRGGMVHGATDEIGFHAVEDRHYVTDVHATILKLLGLDSRSLKFPGASDWRLTTERRLRRFWHRLVFTHGEDVRAKRPRSPQIPKKLTVLPTATRAPACIAPAKVVISTETRTPPYEVSGAAARVSKYSSRTPFMRGISRPLRAVNHRSWLW